MNEEICDDCGESIDDCECMTSWDMEDPHDSGGYAGMYER